METSEGKELIKRGPSSKVTQGVCVCVYLLFSTSNQLYFFQQEIEYVIMNIKNQNY